MTPDERARLLAIAREAAEATAGGAAPRPATGLPHALLDPGAAFVTLRVGGELRGCIGHLEAHKPLWLSVQEMAVAASSRDDRFAPLAPADLPRLSIGISVLSPMRRARPEEVVIGTHGLHVRIERASGLLLPQVPVEWGWDRAEFLRQACRKAGLPPDAFLDPACELSVFTAEVFGDEEPSQGTQ